LATMRYLGGVLGIVGLGLVQSAAVPPEAIDASTALAEHRDALWMFAVALAGAVACATVLPGRAAPAEAAG
ncbi:MAG: MFS transporter, partial [Myxococcota bacterium]|nr:MFS transporter [Myxococcota bacterium]